MTQFPRNLNSNLTVGDNGGQSPKHLDAGAMPGNEGHRRNPLLALWHHRWIVVITLVLSCIVAVVRLYRAQTIYEASARLTVDRSGPRMVSNDPSEAVGQAQN